jgi:hypothetical protein
VLHVLLCCKLQTNHVRVSVAPILLLSSCRRVGDTIRFGQSSRLYVLTGPAELMPQEGLSKQQKQQLKLLEAAQVRVCLDVTYVDMQHDPIYSKQRRHAPPAGGCTSAATSLVYVTTAGGSQQATTRAAVAVARVWMRQCAQLISCPLVRPCVHNTCVRTHTVQCLVSNPASVTALDLTKVNQSIS